MTSLKTGLDFVGAVYRNDKKVKYKPTGHLLMWAVFSTIEDKVPMHINQQKLDQYAVNANGI